MMMSSLRGVMERLRPLVGEKCWDYCVFWGISDDQRCIEFLSCCCGGAEGDHLSLGEQFFPLCHVLPCRDVMYQHQRTKACEALDKLPSSMPMDSGNHTQTLLSNLPRWIFIPFMLGSEEIMTTMVLIPVLGGLVELYVSKHVNEDEKIIEFVMAQCNMSLTADHDQEAIQFHGQTSNANGSSMNGDIFLPNDSFSLKSSGQFRQWVLPPGMDSQPWEQHLQNQPSPSSQFGLLNHEFTEANAAHVQHSLRISSDQSLAESVVLSAELGCDQEGMKHGGREDGSGSVYSDQIIDEDDEEECAKGSGRSGRGQKGAKNLLAERRRRKKLNDRMYQLRSLVPNISKMDRASILIDAIAYIKKLEEQSKSLRDELEDTPDQEDGNNNNGNSDNNGNNEKPITSTDDHAIAGKESNAPKQNDGSPCTDDKENHMEPQVEVIPVGKEFFLKVLCEDKPRGFVRLMEAIHALGLEVTNVNVTTYSSLALSVFRVQKRESEGVQAEQVKESLLEVTRGHAGTWLDNARADENGSNMIDHHGTQHQHHLHHHLCDQTSL